MKWRRNFEVVHLCVSLARREEQRGVPLVADKLTSCLWDGDRTLLPHRWLV